MLLATAVIFIGASFAQGGSFGYYWRDFDGSVPADAYPGGLDINNNPIYIGQVYAKFLIPAKIYFNDPTAYYEYDGKEHGVKHNIKILCTEHPEQFEWIKTDNERIKDITDRYLVNGGYEPGCTTYIGRVRSEGEVLVGKALTDNNPLTAGLHVTKNGVGHRFISFEVLSFQPKKLGVTIGVRGGFISR